MNGHTYKIIQQSMSLSEVQANEAKMFMFSYRDALRTLEESARDARMKQQYQSFLTGVIDWQNHSTKLTEELMRRITLFQYSHYYFLNKFKNLPKPDTITFEEFATTLKNAVL